MVAPLLGAESYAGKIFLDSAALGGGEMAGEKSKPAASPTESRQAPPKATSPANMCTEGNHAQRNQVDIERVGAYRQCTLVGTPGRKPHFPG